MLCRFRTLATATRRRALVGITLGLLAVASAFFARAGAAQPLPIYHLQIRAVLTADDNGSHAATITGVQIKARVNTANMIWAGAGIVFDFDPATDIEKVNSTLLNNDCTIYYDAYTAEPTCDKEEHTEERERVALDATHDGSITVYYRYGGGITCDGLFDCHVNESGSGASSRAGHYVRMPGYDHPSPYLLAHELGHYLWNSHTFGHTPASLAEAAEDVKHFIEDPDPDRAKDEGLNVFDGDGLADTPPDPGAGLWKAVKGDDCANGTGDGTQSLTVKFDDSSVETYDLVPDRTNVMSYFLCANLGATSSPQQQVRARSSVEDWNRAHLLGTAPSFAQLDTIWSSTWPAGSTRIASFKLERRAHLLVYDGASGQARIERSRDAAGDGTTAVWSGSWTTGWTSLVSFQLNGKPHVVLYKTATGDAKIVRINGGGLGITTLMTGAWKTGWTSIVPFSLSGTPHLLLYNATTGDAKTVQVAADGTGISTLWIGAWKTGWTSLAPFAIGGSPAVLVYNGTTGDVKLVQIHVGGISTLWTSLWTTGWTSLMPFDRGVQQRLLLYKEATGDVKTLRVGAGGWSTISSATWSTGWTSLASLRLQGLWQTLVYKPGGGTVKLLRITQ